MATALQIIRRALLLVGAIDAEETVPARAEQDARDTLNNLGQRWLASGLLSAWTDATLPTSTLATAATANEAIAYRLAILIAPEYGREVPQSVAENAQQFRAELWRDRLAETVTAGTAKDIILRALRIIAGAGNLPDTVSFVQALATLNAVLAEMHEAAIGLPDYSLSSLADPLGSDIADREAIAYQLAIRLSPEYGIALGAEAAAMASETMGRLRLRYFQPGRVDFSELPSPCAGFNILTGE